MKATLSAAVIVEYDIILHYDGPATYEGKPIMIGQQIKSPTHDKYGPIFFPEQIGFVSGISHNSYYGNEEWVIYVKLEKQIL